MAFKPTPAAMPNIPNLAHVVRKELDITGPQAAQSKHTLIQVIKWASDRCVARLSGSSCMLHLTLGMD
jgi:hypothetical protein